MSASILYEQVKNEDHRSVNVDGPSMFIQNFEKIFGEMPQILTEENHAELRVWSAIDNDEGIEHLIELINKLGAVRVWKKY